MIIENFCKQDVFWEKRINDSADEMGNYYYEPGVTIKCRASKQRSFQRNETGEYIPVDWTVMTTDKIDIGDKLTVNGETFFVVNISYSDTIWLDGSWIGRFVYGAC